jgi:hypothetical protein
MERNRYDIGFRVRGITEYWQTIQAYDHYGAMREAREMLAEIKAAKGERPFAGTLRARRQTSRGQRMF